ncbi:hypothetical protein MPER_02770, partial [Moniliophthora perniciosa FA553]
AHAPEAYRVDLVQVVRLALVVDLDAKGRAIMITKAAILHTTSSASSSSSNGSSNSKDSSASSSSGSSLFERMKTGATSYASSFTSLGDDQEKQEDGDERSRWQQVDEKDTQNGDGYGQAIWSRVASAASTLTVS